MSGASLLLLFCAGRASRMPKSYFTLLLFDGGSLILTSWTGYEAEGGCKFYGRMIPFSDCEWTERALCEYVVLLL